MIIKPVYELELSRIEVYPCCCNIGNNEFRDSCGYANCAELLQILAFKPSAARQAMQIVGIR